MRLSGGPLFALETKVVSAITSHNHPSLGLRHAEHVTIRERPKIGTLGDSDHVMASLPQLLGDRRWDHLIEDGLHPSAAWRRRQLASARSASSSSKRIRSSISVGLSA